MSRKLDEIMKRYNSDELSLWRKLSPEAESEYRKWARDNYVPGSKIDNLWHPIVQDECEQMNREANLSERGMWE